MYQSTVSCHFKGRGGLLAFWYFSLLLTPYLLKQDVSVAFAFAKGNIEEEEKGLYLSLIGVNCIVIAVYAVQREDEIIILINKKGNKLNIQFINIPKSVL